MGVGVCAGGCGHGVGQRRVLRRGVRRVVRRRGSHGAKGADAPRRSVSIVASVEEINAEVERVKAEIAEAERQAAMEAYSGPDDDPGGPRALPPGRG